MGETWEKRLGELCRKLVYEKFGEEELYEAYKETGDELTDEICFSDQIRDCKAEPLGPEPPKDQKKEKKEKKEKDKAKEKARTGKTDEGAAKAAAPGGDA